MSAASTPKFEGRSSELRYRIDDRSPLTFRDIFDEVHTLIATGLPGSHVGTIHFTDNMLKIEVRS